MTRRTREAIASDLRHILTHGDDSPALLVGHLLVAIADLEAVWAPHSIRSIIDKARADAGRDPLP